MATQKGQIVLHGVHMVKGTSTVVEPATYAASWPALADDTFAQDNFTVDANYDFHVLEITHVVASTNQGAHVPLKIQIAPMNDRAWFIQPVYINSVSSLQDAGQPRKLPTKRVLPATRVVNFVFQDVTNL